MPAYDWATGTGDLGDTSSSKGLGDYDWGKIIPAGVGLAGAFLAPKGVNVAGPFADAQSAARTLGQSGSDVAATGSATLAPVLHYLSAMTSGDPSAVLAATMPERRRVIDQYDTAKQATQFAPRGGGTSSALVDANAREASDLAGIGSKARTDAMQTAGALGSSLTQSGLSAENASAAHMANLLGPLLNEQKQDQDSTMKTFASIASLVGMFFL